MPQTILALTAPVKLSSLPSIPRLTAKQPTRSYSSKAINYAADGSMVKGATAAWADYLFLWGSFAKLTRELRTIIFVSDEEKGTHVVYTEAVTICHLKGGKGTVAVPMSFVYTLAKAEKGAGERGLQIWEIRSYLDLATLEKAKSMQEEETYQKGYSRK